jgi:hypothetical protein
MDSKYYGEVLRCHLCHKGSPLDFPNGAEGRAHACMEARTPIFTWNHFYNF